MGTNMTPLFGVARNGNSFGQESGDSGPSTEITGPKDSYGNSTALNTTLKGGLLAPPVPSAPTAGVPMPGMSDIGVSGAAPTPAATGARSRSEYSPLEKMDQGIAMGNAMGELSNTERYQMANPTNAAMPLGGKGGIGSVSPGSSADASMLRQQTANMETLRGKLAGQPLYDRPGFAGGGEVKETPEQLMARMNAKFGGTGAAITEKPAAPAPSPAPAPAPTPAPEAKKFSGLGGVYNLLSGGRKAQIDKAVDGYACGGKVKGHAEGGIVGFAAGGSLDPIYNEQINQARLGNAGNDVHANNPFPQAESPRLAFPQEPVPNYQKVVPLQGPAGQFGVPEGTTLPSPAVGKQAVAAAEQVHAAMPPPAVAAPAAAAPVAAPAAGPSPAAEPAMASKASGPSLESTAPKRSMGGVPNSDSTRWFSQGDAGRVTGPGMAPAEPSLPPTDQAKFDAEVRSRIPPKGSPAPQAAPSATAPAPTAAPNAAGAAEKAASTMEAAAAETKAAKAVGMLGKTANVVKGVASKAAAYGAPAFAAYEAATEKPENIKAFGERIGVDPGTNGGNLVARGADYLNKVGNAATFGLATPVGEAISDAFNDPKYDQYDAPIMGGVQKIAASMGDKLSGWWNRPIAEAKPAARSAPVSGNAPLSGSPVVAAPAAGAAPVADPRFTPDAIQKPMPSGTIRVGPQAQTIQGTSPVDATQLKAPEGGGYITDKSGRAIFLPGGQPSAAPARDPNGHYDAYGNNMAATDQMKAEIRGIQRDRALRDRDYVALAALNSNPELAAENLAKSNMALEQQRSQDRIAEHNVTAGVEGVAYNELMGQLAIEKDPVKRQNLIDQATSTKGRYQIFNDEETESPTGGKLKGKQRMWDNKYGVEVGNTGSAPIAKPTPEHIKLLRDKPTPEFKNEFIKRYGKAEADKVLSGKFAHGGCVGGIGKYKGGGCVTGKQNLASGGEVISGPGSGTSDSVPAHIAETGQPIKLSDGEYELAPAAVAKFGVDRLNDLLSKYHQGESKPVAEGSFIIPADVVKRLGRAYFDHVAKQAA